MVLSEILGGAGATSYLGEALQFDTQTAIYTSAFYSGLSVDDTTFGVVVVPAADVSLEAAEAALDDALAAFLEEGVDPERLERIKMQVRASDIYARDDVSTLARRYGQGLTVGLDIEDIEAWPDLLQAVTEDEILAAAELLQDRDRSVTGYLMPLSDDPAQDAQEVTQ